MLPNDVPSSLQDFQLYCAYSSFGLASSSDVIIDHYSIIRMLLDADRHKHSHTTDLTEVASLCMMICDNVE